MFVRFMKHVEYPNNLSSMIPSIKHLNIKKKHNNILTHFEKNNFKNYYQTEDFWKYKYNWDTNKIIQFHPLQQFHDRDEGRKT